jgi:hypothetical protein
MIEFDRTCYAFTYLFNQSPLVMPVVRENPTTVHTELSDEFCQKAIFTIDWHERDERVLVVVDGDLLSHGLPKSSAVVHSVVVGSRPGSTATLRKKRLEEEGLPRNLWQFGDRLSLQVHRHFILMPAATMAFRRYRPENLAPRYSLVSVKKTLEGRAHVVTHSSSY